MSHKQTDVGARLSELEATVRGLTQELVEANERIRVLEAELEDETKRTGQSDDGPGLEGGDRNGDARGSGDGGGTRQMGDDRQADDEPGSDLDDIIVA